MIPASHRINATLARTTQQLPSSECGVIDLILPNRSKITAETRLHMQPSHFLLHPYKQQRKEKSLSVSQEWMTPFWIADEEFSFPFHVKGHLKRNKAN